MRRRPPRSTLSDSLFPYTTLVRSVVPGIMPIVNTAQLLRFSAACGAEIPRWIRLKLEVLQDDKPALLDFGLDVVTRLGETLLKGGAPGLHFYTLNQAEPTLRLWKNLGLPVSHGPRSEEHTSELQSLMRISYAVFCLNKKKR